jgi:hypothetical protein
VQAVHIVSKESLIFKQVTQPRMKEFNSLSNHSILLS